MSEIEGKLFFHSETGTEGGYFALQRSDYITHEKPAYGIFAKRKVYDPDNVTRQGRVIRSYDDKGEDFNRGLFGSVSNLDIEWSDGVKDMARRSDNVLVESWSYEGIEYVKNGNKLIVYESVVGSLALWSGTVELLPQDPYAKNSYSVVGFAAHHKPIMKSIDSDDWSRFFLDEKNATLLN